MKKFIFVLTFVLFINVIVGCGKQEKNASDIFEEAMKLMMADNENFKKYELHSVSYKMESYVVDSLFNTPYCILNEEEIQGEYSLMTICDSISRFAWGYTFHKKWEKEWSSLFFLGTAMEVEEERIEKVRCLDSLKVYFSRFKEEYKKCDSSFIGYVYKYRLSFMDNGTTNTYTTIVVTDTNKNLKYSPGVWEDVVDEYNEYYTKNGVYDKVMRSIIDSPNTEVLLTDKIFKDYANIN